MFKGSLVALITPMREDGSVDEAAYASFVDWQIREGTHGVVPVGTTGESPTLSHAEHKRVVEIAVEASKGRVPVIAGAGSNSTEEAIDLAKHAKEARADAILVVTPFYSAPPQRGAVSYFAKLGVRTRRPFLIYHIPGRAGFTLAVDTLAAIKDEVPHFAGLKNTDTDVGFVTGALARLGRDFRIFAGLELPTLPMLGIGGCGMMITASNVAPHLVSQLYETFAKGDIDGAIALNLKLYPLFRGVALESSPIPVKYMLKRLGVLKTNEHRSPLVPASPEVEKQLDKVLADMSLI